MSKTAIVTGAASGIGKAVAQNLAEQGHQVVIADLDAEQGAAAAEGMGALFIQADLSQRAACLDLVETCVDHYGGVDILVNNAGFQHVSPIESFPEDVWDKLLSVMLTAPFLLSKYVWPYMQEKQWGRIINLASVHAMVASPNKAAYVSAKHGLIGLTRTAALEGGDQGITVNALCPAYVRTPLVEGQIATQAKLHGIAEKDVIEKIMLQPAAIKRLIEPNEVAEVVAFLCSQAGASITGASWAMDCGWTAR